MISVDFGFISLLHERSGKNCLGGLLSMPKLTKKIDKLNEILRTLQLASTGNMANAPNMQNNLKCDKKHRSDQLIVRKNEGDIDVIKKLKRVVGWMLSRMQKGIEAMQQKYGVDVLMNDDVRNQKFTYHLSHA